MSKYLDSCKTEFWKKVFKAELDYILKELKGYRNILSVGCGPAIIEGELSEHGFDITGIFDNKELEHTNLSGKRLYVAAKYIK